LEKGWATGKESDVSGENCKGLCLNEKGGSTADAQSRSREIVGGAADLLKVRGNTGNHSHQQRRI